jgi:hypothetical protein
MHQLRGALAAQCGDTEKVQETTSEDNPHREELGVEVAIAAPSDATSEVGIVEIHSHQPKLACQVDSLSCSGIDIDIDIDQSTDISTPDHSPRFERASLSAFSPCGSRDTWSMVSPEPSSGSWGAPPYSFVDDFACNIMSAAFPSPISGSSLPLAPMPSFPPSDFFFSGFTFSFSLRLADEHGLGIDVAAASATEEFLIVERVLQDGAVEAWNKQCLDGRAVQGGDAIVRVNGKTERQSILDECKDKLLLKLTIVRRFPAYFPSNGASVAGCFPWSGLEGAWVDQGSAYFGLDWQASSLGAGDRLHARKVPVVL